MAAGQCFLFIFVREHGWPWSQKRFSMSCNDRTNNLALTATSFVKTVTTVENKQKTAVDSKNLSKLPLWLDATWHPKPLVRGPEWTSTHQCSSWPFCPQDGLRFFIPVPDPVLTQNCTTVNLFGLLTFDPFYFLGVLFPTLTIYPAT
jgi:hypothetical protein